MAEKKTTPPTHRLFVVKERKGTKDYWIQVGAAWPHKSGTGFNIKLDAIPTDGELVMLDKSEQPDTETQH
tara:strand:- start:736 stop:945 length:210 start_codon:yes stop_codon:yes gene_type:complete